MTNEMFLKQCEKKAGNVLSLWSDKIYCYYDKSSYRRREFVLTASHSWGTAYCYWSAEDKAKLYEELRKLGATKITGKFTWNYVYIMFDMKKIREQETV